MSIMKFVAPLAVLSVALMPLLFPCAFWHMMMVVDFWYPFIYTSKYVERYHNFIVSRLSDIPEQPAIELNREDANIASIRKASSDFTVPVIIRGAFMGTPAQQHWGNASWWRENYGDEDVMCKYVDDLKYGEAKGCLLQDAMSDSADKRRYVTGESKLFLRRPELLDMLETPYVDSIEPGQRAFSQIFLGFPGMGSDVHTAIGVNYFRQVAGRKSWWLMPPSQTALAFPSLNSNGFVAYTKTRVGKGSEVPSWWFHKMERYYVTLEPGDILVNTPWYWHAVLNRGENPDELVVGCPTRYYVDKSVPAFRSDPVLTTLSLLTMWKNYGGRDQFTQNKDNLQDGILAARQVRVEEWKELGTDGHLVGKEEK